MYQVIVAFKGPEAKVWLSPEFANADAAAARELYAKEANDIWRGYIKGVYLTASGVIVAQAKE